MPDERVFWVSVPCCIGNGAILRSNNLRSRHVEPKMRQVPCSSRCCCSSTGRSIIPIHLARFKNYAASPPGLPASDGVVESRILSPRGQATTARQLEGWQQPTHDGVSCLWRNQLRTAIQGHAVPCVRQSSVIRLPDMANGGSVDLLQTPLAAGNFTGQSLGTTASRVGVKHRRRLRAVPTEFCLEDVGSHGGVRYCTPAGRLGRHARVVIRPAGVKQ